MARSKVSGAAALLFAVVFAWPASACEGTDIVFEDKFSDDAEDALKALERELTVAAIDHINDSLYYTYAPISLEVKPDPSQPKPTYAFVPITKLTAPAQVPPP